MSHADPQGASLVLFDSPERREARELAGALSLRRDQIAELDLEIETLRETLATFEEQYKARLAVEHDALKRIEGTVRALDRLAELLAQTSRAQVSREHKRLDKRRDKEIKEQAQRVAERRRQRIAAEAQAAEKSARHHDGAPSDEPKKTAAERLKTAYRALARRYHPDLARTEEERKKSGELMARINALYHAGDLARLEILAEQAKGAEIEESDIPLDEQLETLRERLAWFDVVLQNLHDERAALERTSTCELMRNVEMAQAAGRDLIGEIQAELRTREQSSYKYVREAALRLEAQVMRYNRDQASQLATRKEATALAERFDPFADKSLVRFGLEELATLQTSAATQKMAARLEALASDEPDMLRLVLLTYVAELSPFPLPGLSTYEHIAVRLEELRQKGERERSLEELLTLADELVEYGVKQATARVAHTGLRFRATTAREAIPVLLKSLSIRREFRRILGVLGEREKCPACKKMVFVMPLFRTHGLDDLRANVCPRCAHVLQSYWMPKGKDVQAVLNTAFLDFELLTEWSFSFGRGTVGLQLLPKEVETLRVADLKERFVREVLTRYAIEIEPSDVRLFHDDKPVAEKSKLIDVTSRRFVVRFVESATLSETEALEVVRHRVRARFRGG